MVERRLARPPGLGPEALDRPGRAPHRRRAGRRTSGWGRPAPSARSPKMRRMGEAVGPPSTNTPSPRSPRAHEGRHQVVDVDEVDPVQPVPREPAHVAGQQAGDTGQHPVGVARPVDDGGAGDDRATGAGPGRHQLLRRQLGPPVGRRRRRRGGVVGRPRLVPPVDRRGAQEHQPGVGLDRGQQRRRPVDVHGPQLVGRAPVGAGQVVDEPAAPGRVGQVARDHLHAGRRRPHLGRGLLRAHQHPHRPAGRGRGRGRGQRRHQVASDEPRPAGDEDDPGVAQDSTATVSRTLVGFFTMLTAMRDAAPGSTSMLV